MILRLPLLVLGGLLLAALVVALVGGSRSGSHHAAPAPTASTVAGRFALDPTAYAGQPAATAVARLRALGLAARTQEVGDPGTPGTVVAVTAADGSPLPATVTVGQTVLVPSGGGAMTARRPACGAAVGLATTAGPQEPETRADRKDR